MIRDFLGTAMEDDSDVLGTKLRDIYRDLGATLLVSVEGGFLLLGKDEPFSFVSGDFVRGTGLEVEMDFDTLGVAFFGVLAIVDTNFFFTFPTLLCFFIGIIYTTKIAENIIHQIDIISNTNFSCID